MNIDISIVDLAFCLWKSASGHAVYICYGDKLESLKAEKRQLNALKEDLETELQMVTTGRLKPRLVVKNWIEMVNETMVQVDKLIGQCPQQEMQRNCLGLVGGCNVKNCLTRYKTGKEIEAKLNEVRELKVTGTSYTNQVAVGVVYGKLVQFNYFDRSSKALQ